MARDPYIEQRLINWGRWKAGDGAGGLGFAGTNWLAFDSGDRYSTSKPVLPEDEDNVTDMAVRSLVVELQDALVMQYIEGGSTERKIGRLGCHKDTFHARLNAAHRGVSAWLSERDRVAREERERVESIQKSVSAGLATRVKASIAERERTDAILKPTPIRVRKRG